MLQLFIQAAKVLIIALAVAVAGTHYLLEPMPEALMASGILAISTLLLSMTGEQIMRRYNRS